MKILLFYAFVFAIILCSAAYLVYEIGKTVGEMGVYSFYSWRPR